MKKLSIYMPFLLLLMMTFTSCEVIGDIFQAGIWVGIIVVILVVALIIWIIRKVS